MSVDGAGRSVRRVVVRAGLRVEARGGVYRDFARLAFGILRSARDTFRHREPRYLWWLRDRQMWLHRWPEGRMIDSRRWLEWRDWATSGGYDLDDLLFRHYRPKAGDVVIDVGAGHGGETFALASMVGPRGRVLSIEAAPGTFARLQELRDLNGWKQVETLQVAVAGEPGTLTISDSESWITANVFESGDVAVEAVTLDSLCSERGITRIDWVKMNIEGAERDALRGLEVMAPRLRNVTISCHDFLGTEWGRSRDVVIGWLIEHGFTVQARDEGEPWARDYVYAWR